MVAAGDVVASVVPGVDVAELDGEDGALKAVHASVPADFVVVVAAAHAVLAEHSGALGEVAGIGGDHARVAGGAEVFGGIEAEGGDVAEGPGLDSAPLCAPGLGGVFNELEVALLRDAGEGGPVGALTEEVNRQDGADGVSLGTVESGSTAAGERLKVAGSISARTAVASARRMALTEAKKLNGVVTTAVLGPIPAAARASQRASVPEEQPMAWFTPNCWAAACSKWETGSPRINCCV